MVGQGTSPRNNVAEPRRLLAAPTHSTGRNRAPLEGRARGSSPTSRLQASQISANVTPNHNATNACSLQPPPGSPADQTYVQIRTDAAQVVPARIEVIPSFPFWLDTANLS